MAVKPKTTTPEKHNDPTRQRLINIAGRLFAEQGFAAASVREKYNIKYTKFGI